MTITQTVEIPADRRLIIDIPREIPEGKARFEYNIIPFVKKEETPIEAQTGTKTPHTDRLLSLLSNIGEVNIDEMLKDCPHTRALVGLLEGLVPSDITLEQIRDERLARQLK